MQLSVVLLRVGQQAPVAVLLRQRDQRNARVIYGVDVPGRVAVLVAGDEFVPDGTVVTAPDGAGAVVVVVGPKCVAELEDAREVPDLGRLVVAFFPAENLVVLAGGGPDGAGRPLAREELAHCVGQASVHDGNDDDRLALCRVGGECQLVADELRFGLVGRPHGDLRPVEQEKGTVVLVVRAVCESDEVAGSSCRFDGDDLQVGGFARGQADCLGEIRPVGQGDSSLMMAT